MQTTYIVIHALLPILAIICTGYLARRLGWINEVADRNKVGYEFWKKLLEPISLICLIIFALGISLRAIGRDKSLDRFVLGILIAFGFNLLIKIFGNVSLILGWSAFWGILLSSLILLYFGIRIIRRV